MKKIFCLVFVLSLLSVMAYAGSPVLDGTLDASAGYTLLASTTASAATGFGSACDCSGIWYTYDSNSIYIFVQGAVDVTATNGILVCIGNPTLSGASIGQALGLTANSGNAVFSNPGSGSAWAMDFVVQMGIYGNCGSSSNYYVNDAIYLSNSVSSSGYIGNTGVTGTTIVSGGVTGASCALNNAANTSGIGSSTGFELALPRNSVVGQLDAGGSLNIFAMIVSSSAYFSNDGIPFFSGSNLGGSPNFSTIGGGPWHVTASPVPVELSNFSAK